MNETRLALRRFRQRPGRRVGGVVTLALGIGASTSAFSAVRTVLLEPLPVEAEDELVVIWQRSVARDFDHVPILPAGLEAVREAGDVFAGVAGVETVGARPGLGEGSDGTFAINHVRVAGDYFGVLGVEPEAGRLLGLADDRVGTAANVVISHDYWRRAYGADVEVLGRTLRYAGVSYTIVGVADRRFDYPVGTEVWATLRGSYPDWDEDEQPARSELDLIVRLGPGGTLADAKATIDRIYRDAADLQYIGNDLVAEGEAFADLVVGPLRITLWTTLGAALGLLLVSIANATLLLLAGSVGVAREFAVRRALGASGSQVIRPLLADAGLQAALGAVAGLALARLATAVLVPLAPADFARLQETSVSGGAVVFAGILAAVTMVGSAGVAGIWLAGREPRETLLGGARATGQGGHGLRRAIASSQVALAVLAAVGAGMLWQTVRNLESLDRGFDPEELYVVNLALPFGFFAPPTDYRDAVVEVAERLSARAGIAGASPTFSAPLMERGGIDFAPRIEGQTADEARGNPYLGFDAVGLRYFEVARTDLIEGRLFGPEDGISDAPTILVNEAAARALWPGVSPLGRQVFMGGLSREEWRTVVGVVENHRFRTFPEARPAAYLPVRQYDRLVPTRLLVRADRAAGPAAGALKRAVEEEFAAVFPGVDVLNIESMNDVMRRPLMRPRFAAVVLLAFAVVTLLLAALGVHGVFSVLVRERRRDLGIRIALGAATVDVVGFMTRRVLSVGLTGAVLGGAVSLWATGLIDTLFYGVSAGDPLTIVTMSAAVVVIALFAGVLPTLHAIRIDPVESLRAE